MYLFYIDESGNTGRDLDSPEQPVHWLVGVGVESTRLPKVERDLRDLARHYCPGEARDPDFEFHGSAIFHGRRPFNHLAPEKRVDLYRQLLSVVPRHDLKVFVRGIHKRRHRNRAARRRYSPDHPHRLGFMFLVERIDRWLEEIQPDGPEDRPLYGLLVADEQRSVERDIIESLPHWRESGTDFGFRKIRYLVDTLHTVPSHDSWLIQLADCLAYLTNRQHRGDLLLEKGGRSKLARGPQAVLDMYSSHIARQVVTRHIWP